MQHLIQVALQSTGQEGHREIFWPNRNRVNAGPDEALRNSIDLGNFGVVYLNFGE
jgi:hypothetical protein